MLPARGWEIYYNDGRIFNSKTAKWRDLPVDGVLIVLIWHDYHVPGCRQKDILVGLDYYYYSNVNNWGATNNYDDVRRKNFKRGVWTDDLLMSETYRKAFEKRDF
ncbi:hypothetical protein JW960_26180 [candidate division KSB1 bacterium]|nr:hypothetical protein [candidate division KSB1 bacterium]